jgi:hypothetical protein
MMSSKIPLILLLSVMWTAPGMSHSEAAENILQNPGFEVEDQAGWPTGWWTWSERTHFSLDNNIARYGSKSLRMTVQDPKTYDVLIAQTVPVIPGKSYNISAWIRTENVTGPGAQIFIEWNHRDGYWLGGEWNAQTITGTQEAWQFSGVTGVQIPEEAATSANVYLRLIQGSTGVAWFDDVVVEKQVQPLMRSFVLQPNYRGKVLPGSPSPEIELEITLNPEDHNLTLGQLEIVASLKNKATGDVVVNQNLMALSNTFEVSLDIPSDTPPGDYDLDIGVYKAGEQLAVDTHPIKKLTQEDLSGLTSYIDRHNRFILNGEPFFPIGLYVVQSLSDTSQLDEIANSPFDTLMNYNINGGTDSEIANYLDQLQLRNLKLIFSLKEYIGHGQQDIDTITHKVTTFKNRPAVIGWYMNDEHGLEYLPELEARYRKVGEEDENHPVWSVNWRKYVLIGEAHTTDILGVDPYPIPGAITLVSEMADWAEEAGRGYRPLWLVPQIFDWSDYGREGRPPTREEVRAMTYLAINHGAKGLIYYSYFNIRDDADYETRWEQVKEVTGELDYLKTVFLSTQETNENDITCNNQSIDFRLMREGGTYYLFAVNTNSETIGGVSFQNGLADKPAVVDVLFEADRQIAVNNGSFADDFGPYEVHVYQWKESSLPAIERIRPISREPGEVIRIIGDKFGDTQGDSTVHIGGRTLNSSSPRIKLWSDAKIRIRIPKYNCRWFKGQDFRRVKVWVTVGGVNTNKKNLKVMKPATCQ